MFSFIIDHLDGIFALLACAASLASLIITMRVNGKINLKNEDGVNTEAGKDLSLRALANPMNWWPFLLSKTKGKTTGSKIRRLIAYGAFVSILFLFAEATILDNYVFGIEAYVFLIYAVGFFISSTFYVLGLSDEDFVVDPVRLIKDTCLSCTFLILSCAIFYRDGGITSTVCMPPADTSKWNSVYFSAVTFSTLGYGDLKPCGYAKIIAVMQAIMGNVHLAFLVSASFLAISAKKPKKTKSDKG